MNIFVLNKDPFVAPSHLCDKHVPKMVLETAQILCTALSDRTEVPYKPTHKNHPCTLWTKQTLGNLSWLAKYGTTLCEEYTRRFDKVHKSEAVIYTCYDFLVSNYVFNVFVPEAWVLTPFAQAIPDQYKQNDAVEAYRDYYWHEKRRFAKWEKGREAPDWWKERCES